MTILTPDSAIAAIERALAEGPTPGPWLANDHTNPIFADERAQWIGYAWVGFGGNSAGRFQAKLADLDRRKDGCEKFRQQAAVDAAYIAAANPAALRLLLAALREAQEWLPIATAPKDGTPILGLEPKLKAAISKLTQERDQARQEAQRLREALRGLIRYAGVEDDDSHEEPRAARAALNTPQAGEQA